MSNAGEMGGSRRGQIAYRLMMGAPDERRLNTQSLPGLSRNKQFYVFNISLRDLMTGAVYVYNDRFILVDTAGSLSDGRRVFESEQHAADYLLLRFKELNIEAALAVPTKQRELP